MREQRMEMTERSPLLSRITHGYWLRRRMYLSIIIIYSFNKATPKKLLMATNFIKRHLPYAMGMQLMEINVTFSKKLNLLDNPGSKIRTLL